MNLDREVMAMTRLRQTITAQCFVKTLERSGKKDFYHQEKMSAALLGKASVVDLLVLVKT